MEEALRKHGLIYSYKARDEEWACAWVKKTKQEPGRPFLSGNYTALKTWGHIAVLRTLRSILNFCSWSCDNIVCGEGCRNSSLPLGKSLCLAENHSAGGHRQLHPSHVLPERCHQHLLLSFGCCGTRSCAADVTDCAAAHKEVVLWEIMSKPSQAGLSKLLHSKLLQKDGKCYFLSMLHLHYMNQKLAVNHPESALHSQGRVPSLQGRLYSCISSAASSSLAGCRH